MFQQQNPTNYGYTYGVARPQARNTQPLTPEQISKLRQDGNAFDMKVEVEDLWRAACTHKEKNGQSTLIENTDGTWTCTICHETFKMCDADKDEIKASVNTLIDMLQTSKTIYVDAPEELIRQYYQMIPLLKKFPDLWERAMKNFSMYEGTAIPGMNPMGPGYSGYTAIQNLLTNPYAGYGYQAPMAQAPVQQGYVAYPNGGFYGQPAAYAPVDPSMNPMAYGQPASVAPAPVAAAPAPGVMPGGVPVASAATSAAAPANAEVQQQQVFNV